MPHFDVLAIFLLAVTIFVSLFAVKKFYRLSAPYIAFPNFKGLTERRPTLLEKRFSIPSWLYALGFLFLAVAFTDPYLLEKRSLDQSKEGVAIYLLLDRSGSMNQPAQRGFWGGDDHLTKFDVLKEVTTKFIQELPQDLIGVIAFARGAQVISPLTLNHKDLLKKLQKLKVVSKKEEDGTAMGYAIYKTAHFISAMKQYQKNHPEESSSYDLKSASMIVVTDGLQDPSALDRGNRLRTVDLEEAAQFVKEAGIKLYVINIEPRLLEEKFAPNRRQLEKITQMTGGELFIAKKEAEIAPMLQRISTEEKSRFPQLDQGNTFTKIPFYSWFIALSLVCFASAFFLKKTIFRSLP